MKKYALLSLLNGANKVMDECYARTTVEAVGKFQRAWPGLELNSEGYAKNMDITYCIAEYLC